MLAPAAAAAVAHARCAAIRAADGSGRSRAAGPAAARQHVSAACTSMCPASSSHRCSSLLPHRSLRRSVLARGAGAAGVEDWPEDTKGRPLKDIIAQQQKSQQQNDDGGEGRVVRGSGKGVDGKAADGTSLLTGKVADTTTTAASPDSSLGVVLTHVSADFDTLSSGGGGAAQVQVS
jgi:hypothetical protein